MIITTSPQREDPSPLPRWSLGSPGDQLRSRRAERQNWDANPQVQHLSKKFDISLPQEGPHIPSPGLPQNQPSDHLHPPPSCSPGTLSGREGGEARGGPRPSAADSPRLPFFFARPVPAAKKPGPPLGAVTKGAAIPTITRVPVMRVRASPRGQEGLSALAPPRPLLPSLPCPWGQQRAHRTADRMGRRGPGAPNLTEQAWKPRLPDSPPFVQRKRWLTVERQSPRGQILGGRRGRSGLHSQAVAFSPRGSGLRTPLPSAARSLGSVISSLRERSNEHCPENAALVLLGAKLPPNSRCLLHLPSPTPLA